MGRLEDRFYSEQDLLKYIEEHGPIEMHDMQNLWRNSTDKYQGVHHYYIYDCFTSNGSCGESFIFPTKPNQYVGSCGEQWPTNFNNLR